MTCPQTTRTHAGSQTHREQPRHSLIGAASPIVVDSACLQPFVRLEPKFAAAAFERPDGQVSVMAMNRLDLT